MNNQREIYEALLAGETLIHTKSQGKIYLTSSNVLSRGDFNLSHWETFEIYKEPKWYENIPEGGVLCWNIDSSNGESSEYTSIIHNNTVANGKDFQPLTKQEIQVFMDNAPENN